MIYHQIPSHCIEDISNMDPSTLPNNGKEGVLLTSIFSNWLNGNPGKWRIITVNGDLFIVLDSTMSEQFTKIWSTPG